LTYTTNRSIYAVTKRIQNKKPPPQRGNGHYADSNTNFAETNLIFALATAKVSLSTTRSFKNYILRD